MKQPLEDISAFLDQDDFGNYIDSDGHLVNEYGQLIDEFGDLLECSENEGFADGDENADVEDSSVEEELPSVEKPESVYMQPATEKTITEAVKEAQDLRNVVFDIPLRNIKELCELPDTIQIPVHDIILTVDTSKFTEQFGMDVRDINSIKAISAALEERLSPEDVLELRNKQVLAINTGASFKIEEGEVVRDLESFQVVVPDLVSKIKIELSDVEVPLDSFQVLNSVKPEFVKQARRLSKVLKTGAAVEILNAIQTAGYETEIDFYMTLLTRMDKESPTVKMALAQLRLLMQYAINVDNLELKAVITEVFING